MCWSIWPPTTAAQRRTLTSSDEKIGLIWPGTMCTIYNMGSANGGQPPAALPTPNPSPFSGVSFLHCRLAACNGWQGSPHFHPRQEMSSNSTATSPSNSSLCHFSSQWVYIFHRSGGKIGQLGEINSDVFITKHFFSYLFRHFSKPFLKAVFSVHSNTALVEDVMLRLYYLYIYIYLQIFTHDFQNTRGFKPEQRRDVEHFVVCALGGLTATACLRKGKGCSAEMFVIR